MRALRGIATDGALANRADPKAAYPAIFSGMRPLSSRFAH